MTTLLIAAAGAAPTKSPDGALGLLVFLGLAVAIYLLFRSMNRHLRKAQRMKVDEQRYMGEAPPNDTRDTRGRRPTRSRR